MPSEDILVTGFDEVRRIFEQWRGPALLRSLRRAQRAALRPIVRDASRDQVVDTGSLADSYRVRAARRRRGRVVHRATSNRFNGATNDQGVFYGGFQNWGWVVPSTGERIQGDEVLARAAAENESQIEPIMVRVMLEELESV